MKQAGIYVNDLYCGVLTEDEEGFHFVYDEAYLAHPDAAPVSPTMPLTAQQYDKEMMLSRLSLVYAIKTVLKNALDILAVNAPEKM